MYNVQSSWSHPLYGLDEDVDELQRKHTALSVMRLTEGSMLAEAIIGIIFCPCMECIFWWKVEIESSENRRGSCGLSWCLFTNLAAPAPLLLTPCWQNVGELFALSCMATQKSSCTSESSEQEALTLIQCNGQILVKVWRSFAKIQQPSWCCALIFSGKEIRVLSELLAKTGALLDRASRAQETTTLCQNPFRAVNCFFLLSLLFVFWFSALPCGLCPHQVC